MNIPNRPRQARPAPTWVNVAKTLIQVAVFWSFFLWVLPMAIVWVERAIGMPSFDLPVWIGWTCFGAASILGFSCGMIFAIWGRGTPLPLDTTTKLVVRGPYRYIRNPMALAGIAQGFSVGLVLGSWGVLVYAILGAFGWQYLARPWEEADLKIRFGETYLRYEKAVPLWYPTLRPYPVLTSADELEPALDSVGQPARATPSEETRL